MSLLKAVRGSLAVGLSLILFSAAAYGQDATIVGTYKLVSRQLPDGSVKTEPDVTGLLTFTKGHRSLNIIWKGPNDILCSYSLASTYRLKPGTLTEKVLFSSLNDHLIGQPVSYDLVGKTQTVRLITGRAPAVAIPPIDPPTMIVDGNTIISTAEGAFVDTWERTEASEAVQATNPD